jgi:hypothetical protein
LRLGGLPQRSPHQPQLRVVSQDPPLHHRRGRKPSGSQDSHVCRLPVTGPAMLGYHSQWTQLGRASRSTIGTDTRRQLPAPHRLASRQVRRWGGAGPGVSG